MTIKNYKQYLEDNSEKIPIAGCWLWKKYTNKQGYGTMKFKGSMQLTHRISYSIFIEPIPETLLVLHRCDNPSCINPHHLWLGTNTDNVKDKVIKGRAGGKLNTTDVIYIRKSTKSSIELSQMFTCSVAQINNIKSKKSWSHI